MKIIASFLFSFYSCTCFGQHFFFGDSTLKRHIVVLHFNTITGAIFPADYAKNWFEAIVPNGVSTGYFTPDSITIRRIDEEIKLQYCEANRQANNLAWDQALEKIKNDSTRTILLKAKLKQEESARKLCPEMLDDFINYDRQYIGYVTECGHRIIVMQFIDFRYDPHINYHYFNYKKFVDKAWMSGNSTWWRVHCRKMYFDLDDNTLTLESEPINCVMLADLGVSVNRSMYHYLPAGIITND